MVTCASLHPDEGLDEGAFDDDDEDLFADPSDDAELNETQRAALQHLQSVFQPYDEHGKDNGSDKQ